MKRNKNCSQNGFWAQIVMLSEALLQFHVRQTSRRFNLHLIATGLQLHVSLRMNAINNGPSNVCSVRLWEAPACHVPGTIGFYP